MTQNTQTGCWLYLLFCSFRRRRGSRCRALRLSDQHKDAWFTTSGCSARSTEGFQFKSSQGHFKYNYIITDILQAHFQPLWAQEINLTHSQSVALCSSKAASKTRIHRKVCTFFYSEENHIFILTNLPRPRAKSIYFPLMDSKLIEK